jgi:hypothetical protein
MDLVGQSTEQFVGVTGARHDDPGNPGGGGWRAKPIGENGRRIGKKAQPL